MSMGPQLEARHVFILSYVLIEPNAPSSVSLDSPHSPWCQELAVTTREVFRQPENSATEVSAKTYRGTKLFVNNSTAIENDKQSCHGCSHNICYHLSQRWPWTHESSADMAALDWAQLHGRPLLELHETFDLSCNLANGGHHSQPL